MFYFEGLRKSYKKCMPENELTEYTVCQPMGFFLSHFFLLNGNQEVCKH